MKSITSRDNAAVKDYLKLKSSKSERDKRGLFTVEGVKMCAEALSAGVEIMSVFVSVRLCEKDENIVSMLKNRENVFEVSEAIEKKLSDTKSPQGIFCVCKKLDKDFDLDTINKGSVFVMLCGVQDPGNVGTIIRTADGLGASGVILTPDCCDIYSPKVVRSAMGSISGMKIKQVEDEEEFLKSVQNTAETVACVLSDDSVTPDKICKGPRPVILVIGSEGKGLKQSTAQLCSQRVMIPMRGGAQSFNAAIAAAILMWEMTK